MEIARVVRQHRQLRQRDGLVLAARGRQSLEDRNRSVLPARCNRAREGRHDDADQPRAARARQSRRAGRRIQERRVLFHVVRQTTEGTLRRFHRSERSADPRHDLGLRARRSARTRTGRALDAQGAARDQRLLHRDRRASRELSPISKTTVRPRPAVGSTPASAPTSKRIARAVATAAVAYTAPNWGWAWPANRRTLYNRASADPDGKPWSERKKYVWWDESAKKWTGVDVPDFPSTKAPNTPANPDAGGMDFHSGSDPFIMMLEGKAQIFVPGGALKDAPIPAHYEPQQSVVQNELYKQQSSPVFGRYDRYRQSDTTSRSTSAFPTFLRPIASPRCRES